MESKTIWTDIQQKDRYIAVNDLVRDSQPNAVYYSLLILSSIIIASGVLLANSAILIGGMLVTPVLTPILLMSLGIVTSRTVVVKKTAKLIVKSVGLVFVISFMASLIFGVPEDKEFFSTALLNDSIKAAFLYFVVAFASGIAATFAWIRKEVSNVLPGISIAVSLVPPIALVGVWLAQADLSLARFFLVVFLFNIVGIIMSSVIVFSLLDFYKTGEVVTRDLLETDKEDTNKINNKTNDE